MGKVNNGKGTEETKKKTKSITLPSLRTKLNKLFQCITGNIVAQQALEARVTKSDDRDMSTSPSRGYDMSVW